MNGLTYKDLGDKFPQIKVSFDSFVLPIVIIQTTDIDLIEDMFARLNDGVLLNAAEKRNAIGGEAISYIRKLIENDFFKLKLKISNNRFQHLEIATRFLMIEEKILKKTAIDTSKSILDKFVSDNKKNIEIEKYFDNSENILNIMNTFFYDNDILLKRQGDMVIYYLLFKLAMMNNCLNNISREKIIEFQEQVKIQSGKDENESNQDNINY